MLQRSLYTAVFTLMLLWSSAQYTQIGSGGFSNTNFGPLRTDTSVNYYSRFAMIYPAATLGDLTHGDELAALAFSHNSFDTMRGTGQLKIYLKSTSQSDFGAGALNWLAEARNGMTLVYSGDPNGLINPSPSDVLFKFNQVNQYIWDTSGNAINLEVLVEYQQTTKQDGYIDWFCENSSTVSGFVSPNENKYRYGSSVAGLDSLTNFSSIIKPTLSLFYPRYNHDLAVKRAYALGTVPLLMRQPDSLKVVIANYGKSTVTNKRLFLKVSGANIYNDTITVASIDPFEEKFVYFNTYQPKLLGTDSLLITAEFDSSLNNNTISKESVVSYNIYSHADPFAGSSGGIGFTGSTGDFLAKFYVLGTSFINQIKVDFTAVGRGFQLGVWNDDGPGQLPGTVLFMSDTSLTSNGTFIMPVLPKVQVSGGYYVGIRQTTNTNVGFSFQYETPVRPHSFYFTAPAGDSLWTPFSPGFNFNFNIQPRLQVANDIAVFNIISPANGDTIEYSLTDSLPLKAKIINYGFQNQGSFIVRMQILNRFAQQVFSKDQIVSLNADDTATVNFGKFSLYNLGQFTAKVTAFLSTDSIPDNNSKASIFDLIKNRDIGVNRIYSPADGDVFDLNRDTFQPTIRVDNYGATAINNFQVRGELLNSKGKILDSDEFTISLGANLNVIKTFKYMKLTESGSILFRAYTILANDSFPANDTAQVTLIARKIDDIAIQNVTTPKAIKYPFNNKIKPYLNIKNEGLNRQDSILIVGKITNTDGIVIYRDTAFRSLAAISISQIIFKEIALNTLGEYVFEANAYIPKDQWRVNDTMRIPFSVVTGNDLMLVRLETPKGVIPVNTKATSPLLEIRNNGFNPILDAKVTCEIINNLNSRVYLDSLSVSLDTSESKLISFSPLEFDDLGDYYVNIINNWSLEQEPGYNDTIYTTYSTRFSKDIGISAHFSPNYNDTLELNETLKPSIQVMNYGLDTMSNTRIAIALVNGAAVAVYQDTLVISQLSPNSLATLSSSIIYSASMFGAHTFTSKILDADDNLVNNELSSNYLVIRRNDVAVVKVDFPLIGQEFPKNTLIKPSATIANLGVNNLSDVTVHCRAFDGFSKVYESTQVISTSAGESIQVNFDSTLTYDKKGILDLEFSVSHTADQLIINDSASTYITFVSGADVSALTSVITKIYPNPFMHSIHIESKELIKNVKVLSITGQEVMNIKVNTTKAEVELPLAKGEYLLEVYYDAHVERIPILKND